MSRELPQGWVEVELPAVANLNMGQSPPSNTYNNEGKGMPFFQGKTEFGEIYPTTVKYCSRPSKIAEPDDILISVRAPVGPTNLCKEKSCIGRGLAAIQPLDEIPSRYMLYYLRSIEVWLSQQGTGSTFTAISKTDLEQLTVPLPPLNEQRRIVAKLEKVLGKVNACQKRLAKIPVILKRFRQSVLAAACEGQLTQDLAVQGRSILWKETTLGEIADEIRTGPFGSALHKSDYIVGGIPVINPVNIIAGKIVPAQEVSVSSSTYERLADYALRDGDIVVARRGEMGRCAVVTHSECGWLCGTGSAILRLKNDAVPTFIQLLISSPSKRAYLSDASVGSTMENLNQRLFKAMPISLPCIAEQQEIVRRVEALFALADQIQVRYEKAKAYVDKLTQSILAKAFRGELVPQDPKDEPASLLLERIRREPVRESEQVGSQSALLCKVKCR
jgi:type I restriction enzyme S subunit